MPSANPRRARANDAASKTSAINLRVPKQTRELIDSAAAAIGKSRREFMLDSARQQAIDVLLDQRLFLLDADQHKALMQVLNDPPPPNAQLKKLMASRSPWEK